MATYEFCVKTPQLINSLHKKNVFPVKSTDIDSYVGDMTFQIPDGTPLWNFVHSPWSATSFL